MKTYTQQEKDKIILDWKLLAKELIENAPKVDGELDLAKVGEDYMAKVTPDKLFSGEHGTTELFTQEEPPEFLKNASGSGRIRPIERVFSAKEGETSKTMTIRLDGREDWFIFRVTEIVEPKQLTFEEAKEKLTEEIKDEKARKALEEALQADADKIAEAMKLNEDGAEKKSFKAAADELGIEYSRHYKYIGMPKREEMGTFYGYKDLIDNNVPGTFSEPKIAGETGYIVYVAAKELEEDQASKSKKLQIADKLTDGSEASFDGGSYQPARTGYADILFRAWLANAYEEAGAERKF